MRLLKKKGTDGPVFPWSQLLVDRGDMEPADLPEPAKVEASSQSAPAAPDGAETVAITDKDELRRLLSERGVSVSPNASLKTLQKTLAATLAGDSDAGD